MGRRALIDLGMHPFRARSKAKDFWHHDRAMLDDLRENYNDGGVDKSYIDAMRAHSQTLFEIMRTDHGDEKHERTEPGGGTRRQRAMLHFEYPLCTGQKGPSQ